MIFSLVPVKDIVSNLDLCFQSGRQKYFDWTTPFTTNSSNNKQKICNTPKRYGI